MLYLNKITLMKILYNRLKLQIQSTAKTNSLNDQLVNATSMATMMGLSWAFGYFLLAPSSVKWHEAMQWLFTITNVFQVCAPRISVMYESINALWNLAIIG